VGALSPDKSKTKNNESMILTHDHDYKKSRIKSKELSLHREISS